MPLDEIRRRVGDVEKHARRRDRGLYACAAVIIPAWAAVMWWLPDLRVTAAISMAAASGLPVRPTGGARPGA